MSIPQVIAITGGIGSGKSVVSRVLRSMGWPVYDCDSSARSLQDSDPGMRRLIADEVTPDALNPDGSLNRQALGRCVFANHYKLQLLNRIVHGAVASDLRAEISRCRLPLFFVETAILYESGFDKMVDAIWEVTAPEPLRIARVMARNAMSESEVRARIASQSPMNNPSHFIIINDGGTPVLPQIIDELTRRI